jgi:hypothetical protein
MNEKFRRHIDACNNAVLPGRRLELRIGPDLVGYVAPEIVGALGAWPSIEIRESGLLLRDAQALPGIARELSARGFFRFRGEAFDVRARAGGPVLSTIDRGALPAFGVMAEGVHLNGLVRRADGLHLWVARRAANKQLDPGKLDHLVAGGVSAGMSPWETLLKEGAEEAALPAGLLAGAVKTGEIGYAMDRGEGLRRDLLHCYDVALPESFVPRAADGEVESFELWPMARAVAAVRDTDDFKFNVNLVLIALFERLGLLD